MDCGCVNTGISIYFQCRILAAKNNVYLKSRESAAEYFGISVSSLANYERGITVPPLDLIMMMADVYGAPQLKNLYCLEQCPLGKQQPVSAEIKTLEAVTVGIIAKLDEKDIEKMRRELLEIAEDGKISPDEEDTSQEPHHVRWFPLCIFLMCFPENNPAYLRRALRFCFLTDTASESDFLTEYTVLSHPDRT